MGCVPKHRVVRMSAALARIEDEGRDLIARAAHREPAKVLARKIGRSPRHVDNLRAGANEPRWPTLIALAMQSPELRSAIGRWLGFEQTAPDVQRAIDELRRYVEARAEEGDQRQR